MIIIVSGLPGSGKSYLAEKLADRLGAVYINSDRLRQRLDAMGKYSFDDKLVVYEQMQKDTETLIEQKNDVVVDATFFHHAMREMFVKLAHERSVPVKVIEVTADESLIKERLRMPRKYSEADFKVYEKVRDDFEEITMPHLLLESTNDNITFMVNKAIQYLKR